MGICSTCLEIFLLGWASFTASCLPSLGPFLCLPSDKNEDSIGLHQFKCIYMRVFAGTVISAALSGGMSFAVWDKP